MQSPSEKLRVYWHHRFAVLWKQLREDGQILEQPPDVSFIFSDRLPSKRGARIHSTEQIVIEVSTRFAIGLHDQLRKVQDVLSALVFRDSQSRRSNRSTVLRVMQGLTTTFVLIHEIFHLVAGHVGWFLAKQKGRIFDEQYLGLQLNSISRKHSARFSSYSATADAYLLESEADCTAVQWMILSMSQPSLSRLLGTKVIPITLFPKRQRLIAFRLVLASVWLVIRKMESARKEIVENSSNTHPLPVTRVFSMFGECLRAYSEIEDIRYDTNGAGQHILSDDDVRSMNEFTRKILAPVLQSDWNPGSALFLPPTSLEAQLRFYLRDFANHLLNHPVETVVGRELLRMERARFRMARALRPFRYYRAAELKRMGTRKRRDKREDP